MKIAVIFGSPILKHPVYSFALLVKIAMNFSIGQFVIFFISSTVVISNFNSKLRNSSISLSAHQITRSLRNSGKISLFWRISGKRSDSRPR